MININTANVIISVVVTCLILSYNMHSFELLAETHVLLSFSMVQIFMYIWKYNYNDILISTNQ